MTHRSRLTAVLIDVPGADHDAETAFWSQALGHQGKRLDNHPEYSFLGQVTPGIEFMVQALQDPAESDARPRIHIDIESDDIDAEVERLKALGAVEVRRVHSWVIMRDPAGIAFCVVKVQVQDMFDQHATTWT
jgi:predicted enzyme related to lactoylglutathione lyase